MKKVVVTEKKEEVSLTLSEMGFNTRREEEEWFANIKPTKPAVPLKVIEFIYDGTDLKVDDCSRKTLSASISGAASSC